MKTIKIADMEITEPMKCSTYNGVVKNCPKGFYLPKLSELIKIMEESDYLLNWEKGTWIFFLSSTKTISGVQWLSRHRNGSWDADWGDLDDSDDVGRVVYVKEVNSQQNKNSVIYPDNEKSEAGTNRDNKPADTRKGREELRKRIVEILADYKYIARANPKNTEETADKIIDIMKDDKTADNNQDFYVVNRYCSNCDCKNTKHIPKGKRIKDFTYVCPNCGVEN
jgi:hypothetical protein